MGGPTVRELLLPDLAATRANAYQPLSIGKRTYGVLATPLYSGGRNRWLIHIHHHNDSTAVLLSSMPARAVVATRLVLLLWLKQENLGKSSLRLGFGSGDCCEFT